MKIQLKKAEIINFKGIKILNIAFKNETFIEGANRSGKTRVTDAFLWCLFGKDSRDRTDFVVKPLDKNNNVIHKLDVSVFLLFDIDGKELKIKRTLRESWVKPRGQKDSILKGNNTFYEWNEADISAGEFEKKRNELINEPHFKLLTNPLYFNLLPWKTRRVMVTGLVTEKINIPNSEFNKLSNKDLEEKRRFLASQIKKTKKELDLIPVRIDEADRNKPAPLNWKALQAELQSKERNLDIISSQIIDKSKVLMAFNESRIAEQSEINVLKAGLEMFVSDFKLNNNKERTEIEIKINEVSKQFQVCKYNIESLESDIKTHTTALESQTEIRDKKREEWHKINEREFKEGVCSACGYKLPESDIEQLQEDFTFNNSNELQKISIEGQDIAKKIGELTQKISNNAIELQTENDELKKIVEADVELGVSLLGLKEPDIKESKEYVKLMESYMGAKRKFNSVQKPVINVDELKSQKTTLQSNVDGLKLQLNIRTQITEIDSRIEELETQEKNKAHKLVDLENKEFEIEEYVRLKMTEIEKLINSKFKLAKFKMFEKQLNEGEKEVCETLFEGIPYNSNLNSEARINVGLDIINTFSEFYNVSAPIFIDNRESTTDIIKTGAQIINLIVNPECKTLKIS